MNKKTIYFIMSNSSFYLFLENSNEKNFIINIFKHPHDDFYKVVYADWLEENGDDFYKLVRSALKAPYPGGYGSGDQSSFRKNNISFDVDTDSFYNEFFNTKSIDDKGGIDLYQSTVFDDKNKLLYKTFPTGLVKSTIEDGKFYTVDLNKIDDVNLLRRILVSFLNCTLVDPYRTRSVYGREHDLMFPDSYRKYKYDNSHVTNDVLSTRFDHISHEIENYLEAITFYVGDRNIDKNNKNLKRIIDFYIKPFAENLEKYGAKFKGNYRKLKRAIDRINTDSKSLNFGLNKELIDELNKYCNTIISYMEMP